VSMSKGFWAGASPVQALQSGFSLSVKA
jgi:hypothetical protein